MAERTLHFVDERQYKEIFIPSVAGDEDALNQLLEWASLLSAGWEPRSQAYALVKDARIQWKAAIEGRRVGEVAPRTQDFASRVLNVAYGALSAYRRPAFVLPRGVSFSTLEQSGLGDLHKYVVDAGLLLDDVTQAPGWMKDTARPQAGQGPFAGLYLPKKNVVPFLKTLRSDLRGHAQRLERAGVAPEPALVTLVTLSIEAKESGVGVLELEDALNGPRGVLFPAESVRSHALGNLPGAVTREIRKALGATVEPLAPLPEPVRKPVEAPRTDHGPPVPYSPYSDYKLGQRVEHKKYGVGEVKKIIHRNKALVEFPGGNERTLAMNVPPRGPGEPEPSSQEEITPVSDAPPTDSTPSPPPRYSTPAARPRAQYGDRDES